MSSLPLNKLPFSSEEDHALAVLENRLHRQWIISVLQGELARIHAWNRVQQKRKDGQYLTQAGKYLKIGAERICSDESFTILQKVWELLQAEAKAAEKWQEVVYVVNQGSDNVSVIATIPVERRPRGVVIAPESRKRPKSGR
jgi:hypothetical protein